MNQSPIVPGLDIFDKESSPENCSSPLQVILSQIPSPAEEGTMKPTLMILQPVSDHARMAGMPLQKP
jgi:hypothetical protein